LLDSKNVYWFRRVARGEWEKLPLPIPPKQYTKYFKVNQAFDV